MRGRDSAAPRPRFARRIFQRRATTAPFSTGRIRSNPMHVCLIAEGSYPYVTGGVGKWTHDLIASLPEVDFTVVAVSPTDRPEPEPRYPTLPNVRELRTNYVLSPQEEAPRAAKDQFRKLEVFHHAVKK